MAVRGGEKEQSAAEALERLCGEYWAPLYTFARRRGYEQADAKDLTQGFFYQLLKWELFAAADPDRGRLRTFLLTAFQRHIRDVFGREKALKRGGDLSFISIDAAQAEEEYLRGAESPATPEECYDYVWAQASLQAALGRLRDAESAGSGKVLFLELQPFLGMESAQQEPYAEVARRVGRSEDAIKSAVSRLRAKLTIHLRQQVRETLEEPTESQVDDELRALMRALSRR